MADVPIRSLAFLTLLLVASPVSAQKDDALAPDGRPGFGVGAEKNELLRWLRTPSESELALRSDLEALARDVDVLASVTTGFYRERGYFDLLGPLVEPTLDALHAAYDPLAGDPTLAPSLDEKAARAFAKMHLDTRFRVRRDLLGAWEREAEEVRRGFAVLEGAARGYVTLSDEDATTVARRIDLAAAALRSLRSDLSSLREPVATAKSTGISDEDADAFIDLFNIGDRREREARVAERLELEARRAEQMTELLFTTRLEASAAEHFLWRQESDKLARAAFAEAFAAYPDRDGSDEVPRDLKKLSKTKRRRLAREKAIEGLSHDPFDEELAWIAGRTSFVVFGELESLSHFDRFLVLRGILYYDERSYAGRDLTEREDTALVYIQQFDRQENGGQ